jgi:hypothetical protein
MYSCPSLATHEKKEFHRKIAEIIEITEKIIPDDIDNLHHCHMDSLFSFIKACIQTSSKLLNMQYQMWGIFPKNILTNRPSPICKQLVLIFRQGFFSITSTIAENLRKTVHSHWLLAILVK